MVFKRASIVASLLVFFAAASAGSVPRHPDRSLGIEFRSKDNIYYWKNRPPFAGYWQQDVHYQIAARLDIETRIIHGSEKLTYYNNSPDTLDFVYFHLYQNAFKPGSYLDEYNRSAHSDEIARLTGTRKGQTLIEKMTDGAGRDLQTSLDNTILLVALNQPLQPGDSTIFQIEFKTYFGNYQRRMNYNPARGNEQFNAAHWYPRIAVYDRNARWNTEQHLGREFYGDFGTFEVSLTLPNDFIVAATGFLQNRDEMLPDSLMQKLAIENFADENGENAGKIIIREPGLYKTWRYKAINVHDFAWSADPSFRIGTATWDDVTCYAFVREWKAAWWQDAAQFAADAVKFYSQEVGQYGYHKMIVADVDDGMEYPMITFDGGFSPEYYSLFAHEIGHNWFYGMVGSNETYSPFMDEGFTQYLTIRAMDALVKTPETKAVDKKFTYANNDRERYSNYIQYYNTVKSGRDIALETHSDKYLLEDKGRLQYWQSYYKTGVMLVNLQYVLGEDLHRRAMAHYFEKWKFCHPQRHDFYEAISEFTKWDLRWFFDQWMKKIRTIDYTIEEFSTENRGDHWAAKIKIRRKGSAIMPLDLAFTFADGTSRNALIPLGYEIKKEGDPLVLHKWTGWGDFNDEYEAVVELPQKPVALEIDPSRRLADIYQLDNYASVLPRLQFDAAWKYRPWQADKYKITWRPRLGYNDIDGLRPGVKFSGGYLNGRGFGDHQVKLQIDLGSNFPAQPLSYRFSYLQPVSRLNREAFFAIKSMQNYGYRKNVFIFSQVISGHQWERQNVTAFDLAVIFASAYNLHYLNTPWFFDRGTGIPTTISSHIFRAGLDRRYFYGHDLQRRGRFKLQISNALPGSDQLYSKVEIEAKNEFKFRFLKLRTRAAIAYATANTPAHSLFYAGMGSPIDWLENNWLSARGALPATWARDGRIHAAGGGNLRALHAAAMVKMSREATVADFAGNRLAALNIELALGKPFKKAISALPGISSILQFDLYGFFDLASLQYERDDAKYALPEPLYDAGFGLLWKPAFRNELRGIFGKLTEFRFDFPLYFSNPAAGEKKIRWRWLVGVGLAF